MMNYKTCLPFFFWLTCLISPNVTAQTPATVERFVEIYNSQQYDVAITHFHIAEELSLSERDEEIEGLMASIEILFTEFGQIKNLNRHSQQILSPENLTDINIFSMSETYWDKHQGFQTNQFSCDFENAASGQLKFVLYSSNGKQKLRSVNFGLPISGSNSQAIINRVGKKLHAFYEDRSLYKDALSGQVRLSVLITSTRKAAVVAKELLDTGASFPDVVKKYSIEQSANPQGDMGYVFPEDVLQALQPAAISLGIGEVSDVLQLNGKYVLVKKTDQK